MKTSRHDNFIFMHENDISMHENENFTPGMFFFAPEIFMGSWAVHSFMHEISTNETFGAKFSCMIKFHVHACIFKVKVKLKNKNT